MNKWIQSDERSDNVTGKLALIFLSLTQAGLFFLIVYQRYIQDRPPVYYNDLAVIFAISVVGYWMVSFYLGGLLPEISTRTILVIYLGLVALIALPYTLIRGLPDRDLLATWFLVIFGGPALLVGGYSLAAYLGKKRLDQLAGSEAEHPE